MTEYPGALRVLEKRIFNLSAQIEKQNEDCESFVEATTPTVNLEAWITERRAFHDQFTNALAQYEPMLDKYGESLYDFSTTDKTLKKKKKDDEDNFDQKLAETPKYHRNAEALGTVIRDVERLAATAASSSQPTQISQAAPLDELAKLLQLQVETQMQQTQLLLAKDSKSSTPVKLPVLELPKFDGTVTKYQEFWDLFNASVHTNTKLDAVEKFSYLKGSLRGAALEAISGLSVTSTNYSVAVSLIQDRFGNTQSIVHAHYTALMKIPAASNSASSMRRFYDTTEKHLRSLEANGQDTSQDIFIPMVLQKLPREAIFQLELLKSAEQPAWSVKSLRAAMAKYVSVLEAASQASLHSSGMKSECPNNADSQQRAAPTVESLLTATAHAGNSSRLSPKCVYCTSQHFSDECKQYSTVTSRQQQLADRCFICLKKGHWAKTCQAKRSCYHCHRSSHHRSLCPQVFASPSTLSAQAKVFTSATPVQPHTTATVQLQSKGVNLPTATATMCGPAGIQKGRVLFDTGSSRTFILDTLAKDLQAEVVGEDVLSIASFGSTSRRTMTLPRVEFNLMCIDGSVQEITANVMSWICCPVQKSPIHPDHHPALQKVHLADSIVTEPVKVDIDLLIGTDYYFNIMGTDRIQVSDGLVLLDSKLGFIPAGRTGSASEDNVMGMVAETTEIRDQEYDLKRFWALEDIGVNDDANDMRTQDDIAQDQFKQSLQFVNGRYVVSWPWKDDFIQQPDLPENFQLAFGRLKSLSKRIQRTPEVLEQYHATIVAQLKAGVIEEVPPEEEDDDHGIRHYIPHHCVVRPDSTTTKIRIVYDASAKTQASNNSLNDCLYRGPILLPDLCGILLRFRLHPVGVVSDVEKAFLQIGLSMPDRDVTRFLWCRDPSLPVTHDNVVIYRFCRVPFGVIASPFLLAATVDHHLQQQQTAICDEVRRNIYVDNVIASKSSPQEATAFYKEAKEAFTQASMNLREWATNDEEFRSNIAGSDRSASTDVKVLGMSWNTERDTLSAAPTTSRQQVVLTKRDVLRAMSQFFDPLGLFSPLMMRAKMLMQSIWKLNVSWDDPLPHDVVTDWHDILDDISHASDFRVPRYIGPKVPCNIRYELHVFCDASNQGYGAAAYLRQVGGDHASVHLIYSKTRVAPIKATTTPRLELLAALIGVRMIKFLKAELPVSLSATHLWSDSQCVLAWIANTGKSYPTFIQNRLVEIRQDRSIVYQYVGTTDNPADLPSRGAPLAKLNDTPLWWHGPEWLQSDREKWPSCDTPLDTSDTLLAAAEGPAEAAKKVQTSAKPTPFDLDVKKYSSFSKLVRVSAYATRFVSQCRHRTEHKNKSLTAQEIEDARKLWLRHVQDTEYTEVLEALRTKRKNKLVDDLALFLDDADLIRCKGRMENSSLPYSAKYPVLLPRAGPLTQAVVSDCHRKVLHSGVTHTLSRVRYEFWIPRGRQTVKSILRECTLCKRFNGRPYALPKMAAYPVERVSESKPFAFVGVDYFGPLSVKNNGSAKTWVCLFTCMVTRAIHLEVVTDMTTERFLMALRRFVSRRGTPVKMYSDNAQQFQLAKSTLQLAWEQLVVDDEVLSYVSSNRMEWRFITQLAPWKGGFYERMVGNVKKALRKSIGKLSLNFDELQTILTEVEAMINSRPLIYVTDEIEQILTPAHFLTLSANISLPPGISEPEDPDFFIAMSSAEQLLSTWKKGQQRLHEFWNCWQHNYLASLRERGQSELKQYAHAASRPAVGDVCLIKDDVPRSMWKLGRIVELHTSRDGLSRSATVKAHNQKLLRRSLKHLYPIECGPQDHQPTEPVAEPREKDPAPPTPALSVRPLRQAAVQGLGRLFDLNESNLI